MLKRFHFKKMKTQTFHFAFWKKAKALSQQGWRLDLPMEDVNKMKINRLRSSFSFTYKGGEVE